MLHALYKKSPTSLHDLALVGFLLFDAKFTMVFCDSPAGYVCRVNHRKTVDLPEESNDIVYELLPILKATYQARSMMGITNKVVKQVAAHIDVDLEEDNVIGSSFNTVGVQKKRKRSVEENPENHVKLNSFCVDNFWIDIQKV